MVIIIARFICFNRKIGISLFITLNLYATVDLNYSLKIVVSFIEMQQIV